MNDDEYKVPIQRGLLKPTLLITLFSMIGIIVSFSVQIVLAAKFGAKMEMDSYLAASVVPQFITAVLLGTLNVTFIPIFIEYEIQKSRDEAWKVASIFINFMFLILCFVSFLGYVFASQLISVTAPGFKGEPFWLTVSLVRILLLSIIFSGLNSSLSSIYYAHHQFFRPAIASVIKMSIIFLFVIIFQPLLGIKSIAFGTLLGSIVSFLVLIPIFFKHDGYIFSLDFSNPGVVQIVRVMSPLIIAGLFSKAGTLVERMIASTLPKGSISYLGYSNNIITVLLTVATAGIATAIFPAMARAWAEKDLAKVREYFAKGIRIIMLTTFPIAAIFAVLRIPIIQVVFERGKFDHSTTLAISNVLLIELVVFITSGLGNVIGKGFFISQRTKLLAILSVVQITAYFGYAYLLAKHLSYIGLAIAISMYFFFPMIINTFIMKKIYKGINGRKIFDGFIKVGLASFCCGVVSYLLNSLNIAGNSLVMKTGTAGVGGALIYAFLVVYIFKIDEAIRLKEKVYRKLKISPLSITNSRGY